MLKIVKRGLIYVYMENIILLVVNWNKCKVDNNNNNNYGDFNVDCYVC